MKEIKQGLTPSSIRQSRNQNGSNDIKFNTGKSLGKRLLTALFSLSQIALLIALIISFQLNQTETDNQYLTYMILGFYLIKVILSFIASSKKDISYEECMNKDVKVVREGKVTTIQASELVVGDLYCVSNNDDVLADGIIYQAAQLMVNESIFNIRNKLVTKKQGDNIYLGSSIVYGSAIIEITSVGKNTVLGSLTSLSNERLTIEKKMMRFDHIITVILMVLAGILFGQAISPSFVIELDKLGEVLKDCCMICLVAGIDLSDIVSLFVIKRCLKNLTKQKITLLKDQDMENYSHLDLVILDRKDSLIKQSKAVVQQYADNLDLIGLGLGLYAKDHEDDYKEAFTIFSKDRKFNIDKLKVNMPLVRRSDNSSFSHIVSHLYRNQGGYTLFSLGEVDDLLDVCKFIYSDDKDIFFGARERELIGRQCAAMKSAGQEVIGVAYQLRNKDIDNINEVKDLSFIGLIGLMHPLKDDILPMMKNFEKENIKVMLFSEERDDITAINAIEAGIINQPSQILTSKELEGMTERRLVANFDQYQVFTNLTGLQKGRIIEAAMQSYERVGVSVKSVEELRAIPTSAIRITSNLSTSKYVQPLGDVFLENQTFTTIFETTKKVGKVLENYYKAMIYCLSSFIGLALLVLTNVICSYFKVKDIELIDPAMILISAVLIMIISVSIAYYESKKTGTKDNQKFIAITLLHALGFVLIGCSLFVTTIYLKHPLAYFYAGLLLLIYFSGLTFEHHQKGGLCLRMIMLLLGIILISSIVAYGYMILKIDIVEVAMIVYVVEPLLILLFHTISKKMIYR